MKSYTVAMPKRDLKIYGTAVVGAKGQFVIPADARAEMDLREGDRLVIVGSPSKKFIGVLRDDVFEKFLSFLHLRLERGMAMANNLTEFDDFAKTILQSHDRKRTIKLRVPKSSLKRN